MQRFYTYYGGIYFAGEHTLTSITQIGANGTSTLPAMSFVYQNLSTHRFDDSALIPIYDGNPGNPAQFGWPHLWKVQSGYSGAADTVTFSYTEKPAWVNNIWTREVVTGS